MAHLREAGHEVETVAANVADEEELKAVFTAHEERYGRLDVLVNNAGVGIGAPLDEIADQIPRHAAGGEPALGHPRHARRAAAAAQGGRRAPKALIVNTASIAGKSGQPWLSIYGATKAAVINFSVATEREVGGEGIACTALAPAFVDTAMTDFVKGSVPAEEMIRPSDIGEAVRYLLQHLPQLPHPGDRLHPTRRATGAP